MELYSKIIYCFKRQETEWRLRRATAHCSFAPPFPTHIHVILENTHAVECQSYEGLRFRAGFLNFGTIDVFGQIFLCWWGGYPIHYRVFSRIPGSYSLDASSILSPVVTTEICPDIAKLLSGAKSTLTENHRHRAECVMFIPLALM